MPADALLLLVAWVVIATLVLAALVVLVFRIHRLVSGGGPPTPVDHTGPGLGRPGHSTTYRSGAAAVAPRHSREDSYR